LVCHPLTPFAISEDFTAHRASPAHSLHSSSTSLREKHAAPSNTSVEISLDDNKAESGKEPLESFSLVYRQSLRQICRSHNFVDSVAFLSTRIGNKFEVKHLCENDVKCGLEQYREANKNTATEKRYRDMNRER